MLNSKQSLFFFLYVCREILYLRRLSLGGCVRTDHVYFHMYIQYNYVEFTCQIVTEVIRKAMVALAVKTKDRKIE